MSETGTGYKSLARIPRVRDIGRMFIHTVYFWLNESAPESAKKQLLDDCRTYLAKIPTIKHCWAGPAAGTPREVVDNSYAIGLTTVFDDSAGHEVYQTHPLHLEFIARNKANWKRVQVYDHVE
jgi:hypothetical protein